MFLDPKQTVDENAVWGGNGLAQLRAKRNQGTVLTRPLPHYYALWSVPHCGKGWDDRNNIKMS